MNLLKFQVDEEFDKKFFEALHDGKDHHQ